MSRERWFRRDDERETFDWRTPAHELDIDIDTARLLYKQALRMVLDDAARAEPLYLRVLRRFAETRKAKTSEPVPGRMTRMTYEAMPGRYHSPEELAALPPGKFTRVQIEATREERFPGYDLWKETGDLMSARVQAEGVAAEKARLATSVASGVTPQVAPPRAPAEVERRDVERDLAPDAMPPGLAARPRDGELPPTVLARMEHAYGQRFDDVEIHVDSASVPAGQEAITRGRQIYFEPGAFDPDSAHGEQVIAHELAHVAQHARMTGAGRPATRAALEAEAHQAALAALAGQTATVNLAAPAHLALGFSDGEPDHAPVANARSPGPSPHVPAASPRPSPARSRAAPAAKQAAPGPVHSAPAPAPAAPAALAPAAATAHGRDGLLLREAPSALTPAASARLQTIHAGNQGAAAATTELPTADQQTDVARGAVVEPQAEQDGRAQHGVVTDVDDRPPPSPEIEQACARIRQVIRDKRPPSEDKLVDAKPREMAQDAGQEMSAGVEQRAGEVRQGYADMQQPPQGTPSTTPVPATVPPERAQAAPVDAAGGAPDSLGHDDVSLDGDVAAQNQQVADAGMNTEPGKLVKDGPIGDARGGVDDLQHMAKTDPQKVLADQAAAIANAKGDMQALQAAAEKALADARTGTVAHIGTHNTTVKGSEEQQRAQAGEKMNAVFTRTQQSVDTLLQPLAGKAVARWTAGVDQLSTEFENSLADVKRKIDERHSGFGGFINKIGDKAFGLPDWVTASYDLAEAKFGDGAANVIRDISRDVNAVIEDCKKLIEQARKDIDAVVQSLPASLQDWAKGEAAKLNQKLDDLGKRVEQTRQGINKDLINRADGAVQQVRERVADLREQAKGLIGKIAHAIAEFIKDPFKAIVNGLLRILGIPPDQFWSLVGQLGDVVGAIAKDPVKFGKTLISGAGQGFKQFFEHFPTHLKEILMGWLFGQLGTTGIPMPTDFSAAGIMPTVLGIVGIDTSTIMSMFGADVSDPAEMAEVHQELSGVLSGDPHALVALFRDHFDPASLIPMIKEAAMGFLIQALIMQVAPRIAAMLVPGGAILEAVEAIFKVLMWVINNAARIFTLIQSLVATAGQAVAGNTAGVAAGVESGLVQIIVLVIDFLASYIGLGGIGAKLKGVIMKVAGKLKGILKKVVDAIAKRAKAKAKTKHDHKKPGHEHEGAQHPEHEEHDPQKAKDDAKDPRNHKHDPDDKDPRNHRKTDDDQDPRKHHTDHDDRDPKKHKPNEDDHDPKKKKDDDDPKKKHENDLAEAKRAARAAASRGWSAARSATEAEVQPKAELGHVLSRAEHSTPEAKISLDVEDRGKTWTVEAKAAVDAARATDTEGSGWIARGEAGQPWYAARDLSAFNRKLIKDGFQELKQAPGPRSPDDSPDGRAGYDHKVQQGRQLVEKMQQRLDGEIRGLKVGIEMEPWSGVERDHLIHTKLRVAPNTVEDDDEIPDGGSLEPFTAIRKTVAMDGGSEVLSLKPQSSGGERKVEAWIGDTHAVEAFDRILLGPLGVANSKAGYRIVDKAMQRMEDEIWKIRRVRIQSLPGSEGAGVSTSDLKLLAEVAEKAETIVREIGQDLRVSSFADACRLRPVQPEPRLFEFKRPVYTDWRAKYVDQFLAEMDRQLAMQEAGLNKTSVDDWMVNRQSFKPTELLNEVDAGARNMVINTLVFRCKMGKASAENRVAELQTQITDAKQIEQGLRSLTGTPADRAAVSELRAEIAKAGKTVQRKSAEIKRLERALPKLEANVGASEVTVSDLGGGRMNAQEEYRIEHKAAIDAICQLIQDRDERFAEWHDIIKDPAELAVLHNPDQVMGGYPDIACPVPAVPPPDGSDAEDSEAVRGWQSYLMAVKEQLGPQDINGRIGSGWSSKARQLHDEMKAIPEAVWGIRWMHVRLRMKDDGSSGAP